VPVMNPNAIPANLDHRWRQPGLTPSEAERLQRQNIASLDRKITYCLNRPGEPLQYQRVEGWSAREVLDRMRAAGITEDRIRRDLVGERG
jgi:hypothetical protein